MKKQEDKINDALLKVALGFQVAEVTEEYAEENGELKLVKRKKTKKDVPPDLKAVQLLLSVDEGNGELRTWTDEQLEAEKQRLIGVLQNAAHPTEKPKPKRKTAARKSVSGQKKKKQGVKK